MPFLRRAELSEVIEATGDAATEPVIIHGPAGSGKSRFVTEAVGVVSHSVGVRMNSAESTRPFSGVISLLAALPDPRAHHLARAIASAKDRDPFVVAERMLLCLQDAQTLPPLVLIDDADAMDEESTIAVAALARRLVGTPVRFVLLMSTPDARRPFGGLPTLELRPLDRAALRLLLETHVGATPHDAVLERIEAVSDSMPGRALDVVRHLQPLQIVGLAPLPSPLRPGERFAANVLAPLAGLSEAATKALELLACSPRLRATELRAEVGPAAIDELLDRAWASATSGWVWIHDASVRAAVYYEHLDSVERHRVHSSRADTSDDPVDRAWHAAFQRPTIEHASTLRAAAMCLVRSGEIGTALEYLERSLSLPTSDSTVGELLVLAETLFYRGATSAARRLIDIAARMADMDPRARLVSVSLRVRIQYMTSQGVLSTLAADALDRDQHAAPEEASLLIALLAIYSAERWELREAQSYLDRLDALTARDDRAAVIEENARVLVSAMQGRPSSLPGAAEIAIGVTDSAAAVMAWLTRGRALTYAGRYDDARELFTLVIGSSSANDPLWVTTARFYSVENDRLAGDFHGAFTTLADLLRATTDDVTHEPFRLFHEYWYHVEHHADAAAETVLDRLYAALRGRRNPAIAARLDGYLGSRALHHGDLADAVRLLMRARVISTGAVDPQLARVDADLVESLVRSGDASTARTVLADLERRALTAPSRWSELAVERCRALLAPPSESVRGFQALLERFGPQDSDYEYAKTLHAYSGALTAMNMQAEARQALTAAASVFRRIGLPGWALVETPAPAFAVSATEQDVVDLVVAGLRNRQIAETLFVSVRAVEARLTSVYRKLGVSSRAQLVARVGSAETSRCSPLR